MQPRYRALQKAPPALQTTSLRPRSHTSGFCSDHPATQPHLSVSSQFVLAEIPPRTSGFTELNTLRPAAAQAGRARAQCPPPSPPSRRTPAKSYHPQLRFQTGNFSLASFTEKDAQLTHMWVLEELQQRQDLEVLSQVQTRLLLQGSNLTKAGSCHRPTTGSGDVPHRSPAPSAAQNHSKSLTGRTRHNSFSLLAGLKESPWRAGPSRTAAGGRGRWSLQKRCRPTGRAAAGRLARGAGLLRRQRTPPALPPGDRPPRPAARAPLVHGRTEREAPLPTVCSKSPLTAGNR